MRIAFNTMRLNGVLLAGLLIAGCSAMDTNVARMNSDVQRISVGEPYPVPAKVLTSAMLQAGFTPEQILKFGPKVRNAIGAAGGAQVNDGNVALAIFSIQDQQLYVTSRQTGTFIRNL